MAEDGADAVPLRVDRDARRLSLDPRDPRFYGDPGAAYARILAVAPVLYWEELGCWCVFGEAEVQRLLRDRRFGREVLHVATREQLGWPAPLPHTAAFDAVEATSLLEREGPFHTRVRRLVNRAFGSRRVEGLRPAIETMAHALIDRFPAGPFDLLAAYAAPIPAQLIGRLMGVPEEAVPQLVAWSHDMVAMYGVGRTEAVEHRANAAAAAFSAYLHALVAARRSRPADDLLTLLIEAEADDRLSEAELVSTAILLLNAGHEATVHALGNAIRLLLEHDPAPAARLADAAAIAGVVDEALRFAPPLHLFKRYVLEPLVFEGVALRTGDQVALVYGATGRDPRANADPAQFDPTRPAPVHTAFGAGIHFCVGAPLARLELATTLRVLFARCPGLRLTEPPTVRDSWHFHGVERLMVATSPG